MSPDRPERGASLRDVAAKAGVSLATASRVVAGTYPVAAKTRNKVKAAIRELDYDVDRSRSQPQAPVIAVMAADLRPPLITHITAGVEEAAAEAQHVCIVATTSGRPDREERFLRVMIQQRSLEAVIFVGGAVDDAAYRKRMERYQKLLGEAGVLLVFCGRPAVEGVDALVVEFDNQGSAYAITNQLVSWGHRRIGFVGSHPQHTTTRARFEGYREAMTANGLPVGDDLLAFHHANRDGGFAAFDDLRPTERDITAVVCHNDVTASGMLAAARANGLVVPADLSVTGFDDLELAAELTPPLTTVHMPHELMGRTSVELVLQRPAAGSGRTRTVIGGHTVMRESVARRPATS